MKGMQPAPLRSTIVKIKNHNIQGEFDHKFELKKPNIKNPNLLKAQIIEDNFKTMDRFLKYVGQKD
jgi:hypothetical protein